MMAAKSLVQPLFDGPVDIVGDVHGELECLLQVLRHLGYNNLGIHPEGRRLVFLGDLTDRGPDSPGVVELVRSFVDAGYAQCVLGNHDLNILLGQEKLDNGWFFGKPFFHDRALVPQVLATDAIRQGVLDFFSRLPLALERADLRVVHACWQTEMVDLARPARATVDLYNRHADLIERDLQQRSDIDAVARELEHQNRNPVKVLTSGRERRAEAPFESSGKLRYEERVRWWENYEDVEFCFFGHYASPLGQPHGRGRALCIDYAVGKRWTERGQAAPGTAFKFKLAAARFPEKTLLFDDGSTAKLGP
ncbi:MAG TPA: metallophosphoesterase [Gemmataceae bacterium]|nr:metallophosphoesterase [Gemmataceae bacterium]